MSEKQEACENRKRRRISLWSLLRAGQSFKLMEIAQECANKRDAVVVLYNGEISEDGFFKLVTEVRRSSPAKTVLLVLVTSGGSPDVAYKCARHLQRLFKKFSVFIPSHCKSAGTLIAIGAHEVIIGPHGELGPLDVQIRDPGNLHGEMISGADMMSGLKALTESCAHSFTEYVAEIIHRSHGDVSLRTSMEMAVTLVSNLYGPIFGQIDPNYAGQVARCMSMVWDYAMRLAITGQNIDESEIVHLVYKYSDHGFVIDSEEVKDLFRNVEWADQNLLKLHDRLGKRGLLRSSGYDIELLASPN